MPFWPDSCPAAWTDSSTSPAAYTDSSDASSAAWTDAWTDSSDASTGASWYQTTFRWLLSRQR